MTTTSKSSKFSVWDERTWSARERRSVAALLFILGLLIFFTVVLDSLWREPGGPSRVIIAILLMGGALIWAVAPGGLIRYWKR